MVDKSLCPARRSGKPFRFSTAESRNLGRETATLTGAHSSTGAVVEAMLLDRASHDHGTRRRALGNPSLAAVVNPRRHRVS
jgi:hypothetical protein